MGNAVKTCGQMCRPHSVTQSELILDLESAQKIRKSRNLEAPQAISTDPRIVKLYTEQLGRDDSWIRIIEPKIISSNSYYYGETNKGKPHGHARLIANTGLFYEGEFVNGKAYSEKGLVIYPTGSYYIGGIKENKANGRGKLVYSLDKKLSYDGDWLDDLPHGKGRQYLNDGEEYNGDFYHGVKEGKGKFRWPNGDQYEGGFRDGYITGYGKFTLKDKQQIYEGEWFKNKKHGRGKEYFAGGSVYVGNFQDNERVGQGYFLIEGYKVSGKYQEGKFIQSKREKDNTKP